MIDFKINETVRVIYAVGGNICLWGIRGGYLESREELNPILGMGF